MGRRIRAHSAHPADPGAPARHRQEWVLAQESGAGANAETAVQDLLGTTQTLGFRRLPDVAIAAGLLAERAARRNDPAGAERALRMAERLDPGRPETSFAAASVARSEGRWLSALRFEFQGGRRLFDSLPLGRLLRHDLATSAIYVALLSAVAMVALLAGLHGRRVLGVIQGGVGNAIAKPFVIALLALFSSGRWRSTTESAGRSACSRCSCAASSPGTNASC